MRASLRPALLGLLLMTAWAAQASEGRIDLAHELARAPLVARGEVAAVTPYDSGRITVARVHVVKVLKGEAPGGEVLVVERHDLPSRPDLLRVGDRVVVFLVPARRTSSLRQTLPAGTYYELVEDRSGVLSSRSATAIQEAADIVARLADVDRNPAPTAQRAAAVRRALVFDEIAAQHPNVVADGVSGLGRVAGLATTLTPAERQRLEAALGRQDLPVWVRLALIQSVADHGLKVLVPTLRTLPNTTPEIQRASWDALIRLGASPSADDLTPALTNQDPAIRAAAVHGLVASTGTAAIPEVTTLALTDPSRDVRSAAIEALGDSGPAALPSLERAFGTTDQELQQAAARAIYTIGGRAAAETFARLAFEGSPSAQKYAVTLLLMTGIDHDDPLVEHIRSTHPDGDVRHIAADGLDFHEH